MKKYLVDAIKEGRAIDAYAHPEEVRKIIEESIGYMRNVFNDIDVVIDRKVNFFREEGVCFIGDIELNLLEFKMRNLPKYLDSLLEKFEADLAQSATMTNTLTSSHHD